MSAVVTISERITYNPDTASYTVIVSGRYMGSTPQRDVADLWAIAPDDFHVGQRVQSHPATDRFMRGVLYGTVTKIGNTSVHVDFDRADRVFRVNPANILPVTD